MTTRAQRIEQRRIAIGMAGEDIPVAKIATTLGVSRSTVYRWRHSQLAERERSIDKHKVSVHKHGGRLIVEIVVD
jgi:transposase-like protein